MKLITARSNFSLETLDAPARCSGCGRSYRVGSTAYVNHWKNLGRPARTVLCNLEGCWEEWDEKIFPQAHPYDNEARRHDMYEGPEYGR